MLQCRKEGLLYLLAPPPSKWDFVTTGMNWMWHACLPMLGPNKWRDPSRLSILNDEAQLLHYEEVQSSLLGGSIGEVNMKRYGGSKPNTSIDPRQVSDDSSNDSIPQPQGFELKTLTWAETSWTHCILSKFPNHRFHELKWMVVLCHKFWGNLLCSHVIGHIYWTELFVK